MKWKGSPEPVPAGQVNPSPIQQAVTIHSYNYFREQVSAVGHTYRCRQVQTGQFE